MRNLLRFSSLALLGAAALSAHAIAFNDAYSVDQQSVSNTMISGSMSGSAANFAGFVNSTRTLSLNNLVNTAGGDARSRIGVSGGELKFSNDAEVRSVGSVSYAFNTAANLTGSDNVTLNVLSNDIASSVTLTLIDVNNVTRTTTATLPMQMTAFSVNLNNVFDGSGFDRTQVKSLSLAFEGSMQGQDLRLDSVQAVPEPASLAALGVGALGLLRRRRKV